MATILVTGGAGFIGTCFVLAHAKAHPEDTLVVYDKLTYAGNKANLTSFLQEPRHFFVHASINDGETFLQTLHQYKIDTVVNFAAESHVDRSISGPDEFITTNINGTYEVVKALVRYNEETGINVRFHHVSTDEVYGALQPFEPAFVETSPFLPNSPYAASKAAADCLVHSFVTTYKLNATVSHCSNNFGPYQFPEKLIPKTIITLLHGQRVPIYGSGLQIRDWISVEDHCLGIELCLKKGKQGESYNIGAHCEKSNLELIENIGTLLTEELRQNEIFTQKYKDCPLIDHDFAMNDDFIEHVQDRQGHDFRYALACHKAEKELGFPLHEHQEAIFKQELRHTISWYLAHSEWWQELWERA